MGPNIRQLLKNLKPQLMCQRCKRKYSSVMPKLVENVDKYNGVRVNLNQIDSSVSAEEFGTYIIKRLEQWKQDGRSAIWLDVPIMHSKYIPEAAKHGFQFHNAENHQSLLKLWLADVKPDRTPRFATHQVGVSGLVINEEAAEVLVVQDKNSKFNLWKFPGGLSDLEEDIGDTAEREVFEETGVKAKFQSVLAFRQQHQQPGAFGRSDIFVVCRLTPLTFEIDYCQEEIKACQWMKIVDLRNQSNISSITHRITSLALYGLEHGFDNVDVKYEEMNSLYKGLKYKLYHRSLPENDESQTE